MNKCLQAFTRTRVSLDKNIGDANNHKNNCKEVQEATFGESFERQASLPKFKLEESECGLCYQKCGT